jgi:aminopeptidase N
MHRWRWLILLFAPFLALSQQQEETFTRADSLRGLLSPERTCYNLTFYHLDVRIDPSDSSVRGYNDITFRVEAPFHRMQLDLFRNMHLDSTVLDGETLPFSREEDAFFVETHRTLRKGEQHTLRVSYSGKPQVARRPPWQGGFTWERDQGNPWVVVTCQGTGASLWWPNKDQQADRPDSMLISVTVPPGLEDVSNGRLRAKVLLADGWTRYDWFVSYPINNYNVTVNIGRYAHFSDVYAGDDTLTLDYFVLPENLEKAKAHFAQVKQMIGCYEHFFGPYPFPRDGYKLVECPHTGMEHQSAVAYGNRYLGGYRGRAPAEVGLKFDFIIIHESAHEWWGNSIAAKDIADMWIHESFAAYAEALYVEEYYGEDEALKYMNGKKPNIRNRSPIIGVFGVNREGSGDMYDKGQLVLNTLRSSLGNDSLWFSALRSLSEHFRYQTVRGEDIVGYLSSATGRDLHAFFDQYLRFSRIPVLEVSLTKKGEDVVARYRWSADVEDFRMPIRVTLQKGRWDWIAPTSQWQTVKLSGVDPEDFRVEEDRFYVETHLHWSYLDPALQERRAFQLRTR